MREKAIDDPRSDDDVAQQASHCLPILCTLLMYIPTTLVLTHPQTPTNQRNRSEHKRGGSASAGNMATWGEEEGEANRTKSGLRALRRIRADGLRLRPSCGRRDRSSR